MIYFVIVKSSFFYSFISSFPSFPRFPYCYFWEWCETFEIYFFFVDKLAFYSQYIPTTFPAYSQHSHHSQHSRRSHFGNDFLFNLSRRKAQYCISFSFPPFPSFPFWECPETFLGMTLPSFSFISCLCSSYSIVDIFGLFVIPNVPIILDILIPIIPIIPRK